MKCTIYAFVLLWIGCGMAMSGCSQTHPTVKLTDADDFTYRTEASPIEDIRHTPVGTISLEIHGNGVLHYTRADGSHSYVADVDLQPKTVETFFQDLVDAGVLEMDQSADVSTQPLDMRGRLSASSQLLIHVDGKNYRFYWPTYAVLSQSRTVLIQVNSMIERAESSAKLVAN